METYKSITYLFNQTTEAESFGGGKRKIQEASTNIALTKSIIYSTQKREQKELRFVHEEGKRHSNKIKS